MTVIQGDCQSVMQGMADDAFEVTVTSPPYNIDMPYDVYTDKRADYNAWTLSWLREAVRVSRRGVLLNIDQKPSAQTELFSTLGAIASAFKIQNTIIWVKSIHVDESTRGHFKPVNSDKYLNHTHELILHVVDRHHPIDRLANGVTFTDKSNIARFANAGDKRCRGTTWFVPYDTRKAKLAHPASFPQRLAEMMIAYAGGDGPVLDPFCGSGTTLRAARSLGRDATGIEISPNYALLTP